MGAHECVRALHGASFASIYLVDRSVGRSDVLSRADVFSLRSQFRASLAALVLETAMMAVVAVLVRAR